MSLILSTLRWYDGLTNSKRNKCEKIFNKLGAVHNYASCQQNIPPVSPRIVNQF